MKNYAMSAAIALIGFGLMSIGFNLNGSTAIATPGAFNVGPEEPTIVWYDSFTVSTGFNDNNAYAIQTLFYRAWSDGTIEAAKVQVDTSSGGGCLGVAYPGDCSEDWYVLFSSNRGLNAAADINFDERVDGADLAMVLGAWGDAPRNDYPPSDCPLGLIP